MDCSLFQHKRAVVRPTVASVVVAYITAIYAQSMQANAAVCHYVTLSDSLALHS